MNDPHLCDEVPDHEAKEHRVGGLKTSSQQRTTLTTFAAQDFVRDDTPRRTPLLWAPRLLRSLAVSKPPIYRRHIALWDALVAFSFILLWECASPSFFFLSN